MHRSNFVVGSFVLVSLVTLATASCGSSTKKDVARPDDGGAGGEMPTPQGGVGGKPAAGGQGGAPVIPSAGAGGVIDSNAGAGGVPDVNAGAGGVPEVSAGAGGVPDVSAGAGGTPNAGAAGESVGGEGGSGGAAPAPVFRVFNTGVDDQGALLPGGSVDPHYQLIQSAEATLPGPDGYVAEQIAAGYWLAQDETSISKWIAPSPNQSFPNAPVPCNAAGTYVWRTSFDVAESEVEDFAITGGWAADNNAASVKLNGVSLGLPNGGYGAFVPFTIESGFVTGVNTLDFEVVDIGCPNGLRVEMRASVDAPQG